jgi:hypothetical protein
MARGWESKSVEAQQAEASQPQSPKKAALSPEQKRVLQKKEGLLLERKRVQRQVQDATSERYRAMLQAALADLNRKIAALG